LTACKIYRIVSYEKLLAASRAQLGELTMFPRPRDRPRERERERERREREGGKRGAVKGGD